MKLTKKYIPKSKILASSLSLSNIHKDFGKLHGSMVVAQSELAGKALKAAFGARLSADSRYSKLSAAFKRNFFNGVHKALSPRTDNIDKYALGVVATSTRIGHLAGPWGGYLVIHITLKPLLLWPAMLKILVGTGTKPQYAHPVAHVISRLAGRFEQYGLLGLPEAVLASWGRSQEQKYYMGKKVVAGFCMAMACTSAALLCVPRMLVDSMEFILSCAVAAVYGMTLGLAGAVAVTITSGVGADNLTLFASDLKEYSNGMELPLYAERQWCAPSIFSANWLSTPDQNKSQQAMTYLENNATPRNILLSANLLSRVVEPLEGGKGIFLVEDQTHDQCCIKMQAARFEKPLVDFLSQAKTYDLSAPATRLYENLMTLFDGAQRSPHHDAGYGSIAGAQVAAEPQEEAVQLSFSAD